MLENILKVLIVDDDILLREIYRQSFELDGFQVTESENGLEALSFLLNSGAEDLPDCIILDLMMPEMDGGAFLKMIRTTHKSRFQNIPVIICSAFGELPSSEYFSTKFDKPVELRKLLAAVLKVIEKKTISNKVP